MFNKFRKWKNESLIVSISEAVLLCILFGGIVTVLFKTGYFPGSETKQLGNINVIAIIYGSVGVFIALMIPIHYTITLDILSKINSAGPSGPKEKQSKEKQSKEKEELNPESCLLFYCHSAEVLVYAFGLFGASVFLKEAIVIASIFELTVSPILHYILILLYGAALSAGVGLNRYKQSEWFDSEKYIFLNFCYSFTRYSVLILGAIWIAFLAISKCENINAVVALVLLTLYYLLWVMLRLLFTPMTYTKKLLIGNIKRIRKGTWALKNEKTDKSVTLTMNLTAEEDQPDK